MKNEPLSSGNKWILFGSIVVLSLIIYFVWFHKWDEVAEKFQTVTNKPPVTVDDNCVNGLEALLREWLKKKPKVFDAANKCIDMMSAFETATQVTKDSTGKITGSIISSNGTKDTYYTTYAQFLAKLVGDYKILSKYMDFNYDAVLSENTYSTVDYNTKEGFARTFFSKFLNPLIITLRKIRDDINKPSGEYRKPSNPEDYDQTYLNNTVLYIDKFLTKYQNLYEKDMKMGAQNPIMMFLKNAAAVGYQYANPGSNPVKQWLDEFANHIFNLQEVSGADVAKCNIDPSILETSSQALTTMAACNFVVALYRERAKIRKERSSLDPMYLLDDDDITRVLGQFTEGRTLGISIQNKVVGEYYKPTVTADVTAGAGAVTAPEANWNNIIDAEIAEVNGGIRLRSVNDSNRPGAPIPNPKIYDELMNLDNKCKAVSTTDTLCADLVRLVCRNINNLKITLACTVPNIPKFELSPPLMTSVVCGPKGTTTTTTSPAAGTTTTTMAAAGTTTTMAAAGTTTSSSGSSQTGTSSTSTSGSSADLALDTTYQELYNLLRSKLGVLYDGREGDLSNDLIKLIQTMGPVERASLCQVYCNLKQECSQLCKELKCPNCFITQRADSDAEGQPGTTLGFAGIHDAYTLLDYLKGDYLGIKPNVESTQTGGVPYQSGARGPVINQKDTNGISNVFAPYIVMMPKRPGDSYGSYVLNDPNDPAYRDFIDKLVNNY